jgi:hypothetical protein
VEQFIAADGPNTNVLVIDEFLALWEQFEEEQRQRVLKVEGEIQGEEVRLALAPSGGIKDVEIKGHEIQLPDGTRFVSCAPSTYTAQCA